MLIGQKVMKKASEDLIAQKKTELVDRVKALTSSGLSRFDIGESYSSGISRNGFHVSYPKTYTVGKHSWHRYRVTNILKSRVLTEFLG